MLSLCNRALDIFRSSKTAQKRSLLRTVFSNLELNAQNLSWALVSPLSDMVEVVDYKEWLCILDKVRTYHQDGIIAIINRMPPDLLTVLDIEK